MTKDVPPYAIVGGNPAKIIKYRFSEDIIDILNHIDFSILNSSIIKEHIDDLYQKIETKEDVLNLVNQLQGGIKYENNAE